MTKKVELKIIVFANSKSWSSTISRSFDRQKLSWVLDLDSLKNEVFNYESCAAIIEIPQNGQADFFGRLSELSNNSQQVKLFAVGDSLAGFGNLIRASGIAMACSSPLEIPRLIESIRLYEQSLPERLQTLEASIESNLPWATAEFD